MRYCNLLLSFSGTLGLNAPGIFYLEEGFYMKQHLSLDKTLPHQGLLDFSLLLAPHDHQRMGVAE